MTATPTSLVFDLADGPLHALRWGSGERVVLGLHGITANAMSWQAVADRLPDDWSLVAPDQRGRGRSRDLPAPYAVEDLARDAHDVALRTGAEVLAGHSMGAYVAVAVEQAHPGTARRLVLVDGGVPLPVPPGLGPDELQALLVASLGPMVTRLRTAYADEEAYVELFHEHPAMGPYWDEVLEAYARYDVRPEDGAEDGAEDGGDPGSVRAAASEEAVRVSGHELLTRGEEIRSALHGLTTPTTLLTAPRGMLDEDGGFLPATAVEEARHALPHLRVVEVPDTNHYTVLLGRGAAAVASAVTDA